MPGRFSPATIRAALWAWRAHASARRQLRRTGIRPMPRVPDPPDVPAGALRGVVGALGRRGATCLERSVVMQRWYAAEGVEREIVIGVKGSGGEFGAHAWLEGDEPTADAEEFAELIRIPAAEAIGGG